METQRNRWRTAHHISQCKLMDDDVNHICMNLRLSLHDNLAENLLLSLLQDKSVFHGLTGDHSLSKKVLLTREINRRNMELNYDRHGSLQVFDDRLPTREPSSATIE